MSSRLELIEYQADEESGQSMVLLTNEATHEDIIVDGRLVTLCEELESIFTVLDPNKAVKTLDERIADVARGAIASGVAADTRSVSSTTPLV
ncbi:Putative cytoplasmic protein [Salmonella bongori]|nr:Putative cytoplasmic protein [Salmonella bongori]